MDPQTMTEITHLGQDHCRYCGNSTLGSLYCCDACEVLDRQQIKNLTTIENSTYAYLDGKAFRDLYRQPNHNEYNYVFFAEGLHCSSCVHLLEKLPQFCEGISQARVNFGQSTVAIKLDESASLAKVAQVIEELGYKPMPLAPLDDPQEKYTQENRLFLMRIAVAGFCAGNTMLFVIPVYAGLAGAWARAFNWISFGLFLPVLLFSAMPFLQGAWNSLKYKIINIDLPISIALLTGFGLSTINLLRGDGAVYFDSTASFMFLILSVRYLLKRVQQSYLAPQRTASFFQGQKYLVLKQVDGYEFIRTGSTQQFINDSSGTHKIIPASNNIQKENVNSMHNLAIDLLKFTNSTNLQTLPWNKINSGDLVLVKKGQYLPADAKLISPKATLDMSLFNGESLPRDFTEGMNLFAGTKLLDEEICIQLNGDFSQSKLGQMFKQLDQDAYLKSHFVTLTDRLAQKLILVVFILAVVFFITYSFVDVSEALNRTLALIVLACPCALSFGSPLTLGLALKKAQSLGILLRSSNSLEKILKVKNIFFDKTGTLTEGSLGLVRSTPTEISEDLKRIILSLEATSYHPLAFALRKAWKLEGYTLPVEASQEILGQGVTGRIHGKHYEIKHLAETTQGAELGIELFADGHSLCRLYFVDTLRPESSKIVQDLMASGLNCFLLSGDKKARVNSVAQACHIPAAQSFGELLPEDKATILQKYSDTCMIGDGANDSLSLQKANVGIAVKGSVDLSLQSADVYFTRGGLQPLLDLLKLARESRKVLIRNLSISLIYNSIGAILALFGFINPMMAAILMPISSFIIILSSLWGFR